MIWHRAAAFALIISLPLTSPAIDREVAESLKCIRMFPYFERKFRIPSDTLHSIALKESGKAHSKHKIRVAWPWTVNVEGQGYYFNTKREAILFVKKQLVSGKESIDIGCMQINLKHHPDAFPNLDHAFDPQRNVAYGAQFLRSKYDQLGNWHKAIAHYHSATPDLGYKYKQDVIKIAVDMPKYKNSLKHYAHVRPGYNYANNQSPVRPYEKTTHYQRLSKFHNNMNKKPYTTAQNSKKNRSNMMIPIPPTYLNVR